MRPAWKVRLEVGRLVRRSVLRALERAAFDCGVAITVTECMGWIDGDLYITVAGPPESTAAFGRAVAAGCECLTP